MSEFRQNIATNEWIIIAAERARRPEDFRSHKSEIPPQNVTSCPLCSGNEHQTPPEIISYRTAGTQPNSPGWWIRVVPNRFPALTAQGTLKRRKIKDLYVSMDGVGQHEVIIESPYHGATFATMEQKQAEEIFLVYRERSRSLAKDPRHEMIIIFKNHGAGAGTSLSHPHSQVIATAVTPNHIRQRLETAMKHYDSDGTCVYCDIIAVERELQERVVLESDNFLAFEPYAARSPFETWVIPKKHSSSFCSICEDPCKELAAVMQKTLTKISNALNNPDYNFAIFFSPTHEPELEYFHWYIKIVPRISQLAGFEMGSGIYVNTMIPEDAARFLREAPSH